MDSFLKRGTVGVKANRSFLLAENTKICYTYNGRDGVVTDNNGLIYMRARYYKPALRRFVNADILHGDISDPATLNRYAYVNGNPVSFVDPFGLAVGWSTIKDTFNKAKNRINNKMSESVGKFMDFATDVYNFDCNNTDTKKGCGF